MCGRFTISSMSEVLQAIFRLRGLPEGHRARFNVAPGQRVLALPAAAERVARPLQWGLVASWARDPSSGPRPINARAESLESKPMFRPLLARRRCLVLADGFYEWMSVEGRGKVPVYFRLRGGEPFGFAGLWDRWEAPDGGPDLVSCTIVTTRANSLVGRVHDRMPVMFQAPQWDAWLDPERAADAGLLSSLRPMPSAAMEAWPVQPRVNQVGAEGPQCLEPLGLPGWEHGRSETPPPVVPPGPGAEDLPLLAWSRRQRD